LSPVLRFPFFLLFLQKANQMRTVIPGDTRHQTPQKQQPQQPPPLPHQPKNNSMVFFFSSLSHKLAQSIQSLFLLLLYWMIRPFMLLYRKITGTDQLELSHKSLLSPRERQELDKWRLRNLQLRSPPILILDLDETLLHSSLQVPDPQFAHLYQYSINVYIDHVPVTFYVSERPYLKNFMKKVCDWYRVVIFTASVRNYADPVIDRLYYSDRIAGRFFRESCSQFEGMFIKDLTTVCGDNGAEGLSRCIIIDNSPISYMWNQENAIPCESWMADNENDQELLNLLPFLEALRYTSDVRNVLRLRLS